MASSSSRGPRSRRLALLLAWWVGLYQPPDRRALRAIWDTLVVDDPSFHALFVGVRPYTRRLTRSKRKAFVVTIDPDPKMRFFGAHEHRVVPLERIDEHASELFDLAVVNGVLGWGIDTTSDANAALRACRRALRPGGSLVLGVNESRPSTPDLATLTALEEFRPSAPPPFDVHRLVVPSPLEGTHTFLFFERP